MIYYCMEHLRKQLNQFLDRKYDFDEQLVVLSGVSSSEGGQPTNISNKVVLTLANIERETSVNNKGLGGRNELLVTVPVHLNLYVLICANFSSYAEALKLISSAVEFYQLNPVFNKNNSPDLPDGIDKILIDIENVTPHELSNMWGTLGSNYLPSILYKVRMVTIAPDAVVGRNHLVKDSILTINAEMETDNGDD